MSDFNIEEFEKPGFSSLEQLMDYHKIDENALEEEMTRLARIRVEEDVNLLILKFSSLLNKITSNTFDVATGKVRASLEKEIPPNLKSEASQYGVDEVFADEYFTAFTNFSYTYFKELIEAFKGTIPRKALENISSSPVPIEDMVYEAFWEGE